MIQISFCRHSNSLPFGTCAFCNSSAPDKLVDLCFKFILNHNETICERDSVNGRLYLREDISLPLQLYEKFWGFITDQVANGSIPNDSEYVHMFEDTKNTRLKKVTLKKSSLSDDEVEILLKHQLSDIEICDNSAITQDVFDMLSIHSQNLQSVGFGRSGRIFDDACSSGRFLQQDFLFLAPNLKKLKVNNTVLCTPIFFEILLKNFKLLSYLDLSNCNNLGELNYIENLENIRSLVLYNVPSIDKMVKSICKLKLLQHLDVSQSIDKNRKFPKATELLTTIVENLPKLTSLDISGTNLAGTGVAESNRYGSDIPGIISRVNNPFQFLGLYETFHEACSRHDIPAKLIAGNANEEQILISALAYMERPEMLQKVLNDLFHLFRFETCQYIGQALNVVLDAMNKHVMERHIQISGSATLFYIVKSTGNELHNAVNVKRRLISTLLNGMSYFKNDDTMMRNGCLTLCQFKIPVDVVFEYERLVNILLHTFKSMDSESFVQRIGIYLLNSLACQVDGQQKVRLGELGAINLMIQLIQRRLERNLCDDVLEVAWSTMWNVTDETPANCRKFLEDKGMEYFLFCLKKFPDKEELLRNMMGLLGNVAEVQELRHYLVTPEYLSVFSDLLDSHSDGIEVSYNAAGVISHIASDGPEVWTVQDPSRALVLNKMVEAIDRWDLSSQRNINYRSFKPILNLVGVYHTPECQKWAAWALANLTKVYPSKYCHLVEIEGGLEMMGQLMRHPGTPASVKCLAEMVVDNCERFKMGDLDELLDG